jgi:hypothetical protein
MGVLYIRGEIQNEHTLLMGRVTWYITCQSFLLTVYAISYSNSRMPNWFSNIVLPFLAIIITILAQYMINGATTTIEMWGKLRVSLIQEYSKLDSILIPRWRSSQASKKDHIHRRASWFPNLIPLIFFLTWVVIAYFSWHDPWVPIPELTKDCWIHVCPSQKSISSSGA